MRLNKYLALATGMSRRSADNVIAKGQVFINNTPAQLGQQIEPDKDAVLLNGKLVAPPEKPITIMLNKPSGYVCSRDGQGSKTVYDLLPGQYRQLKPVGRLDKESSGLLLLTTDGTLAYELTHPSFQKEKRYEIQLDHDLSKKDFELITKTGVQLEDGPSKLKLNFINDGNTAWKVTMAEGRNRQIRRTFEALGYQVTKLHRTHFGPYTLKVLKSGECTVV
ncbi:MAG TPA: pseudouridine synthase [Candidatus Limnocylindria bacterium]|nr:pseudouridine synthase [Candidatus Limnocylindria bacterium]